MGTSAPSDGEAKAGAEAVVELWRAAPDVAAEVIDDAEDAGRWPDATLLRGRLRSARLGPRGKLASYMLWERWTEMAVPAFHLSNAERRESRRAERAFCDEINERAEAVASGRAPVEPFVRWACEQVPSLDIMLGDAPRPPPPAAAAAQTAKGAVPRWVPPPTAAAKAVAERIVRGERKV
jgi:hypothetical protein